MYYSVSNIPFSASTTHNIQQVQDLSPLKFYPIVCKCPFYKYFYSARWWPL